ncbi:MAG: glycyl-radical enzyme activating protein [Candidatus Cryptobacteroides sp.]
MKEGLITDIQRMSIHDGPGIRTTIFMKGCNFRCRWCHNPETWSKRPQLQYIAGKCTKCGTCGMVCPSQAVGVVDGEHKLDRNRCTECGKCAEACPSQALDVIGTSYDVNTLLEYVLADKVFYDTSSGGITVSGGEPFLQSEFLFEFLSECKKNGLGTAVETNLSVPWNVISDFIGLVDLWMCDLKSMDEKKHMEWTRSGISAVTDNLSRLSESGAEIIVRTPVIPGFNDSEEDIHRICTFLSGLTRPVRYELLPFHTFGFVKYDNVGIVNPMAGYDPMDVIRIEELRKIPPKFGLL